jgi:flagellar basal body-associated protein FliL
MKTFIHITLSMVLGSIITLFVWFIFTKNTMPKEEVEKKFNPEIIITISTAIISNSYGEWVGKGDIRFEVDESIMGYKVESKLGDHVLCKVYCDKENLDHYIDLVKHDSAIRDSIIMTIPAQNQLTK